MVELSTGTHRVADELRRHSLSDGEGGHYSTNLDRNRYGSDNNYLFTGAEGAGCGCRWADAVAERGGQPGGVRHAEQPLPAPARRHRPAELAPHAQPAAVTRYNLEVLGLCPCLVDIEIVDTRNGNESNLVTAGRDACACDDPGRKVLLPLLLCGPGGAGAADGLGAVLGVLPLLAAARAGSDAVPRRACACA